MSKSMVRNRSHQTRVGQMLTPVASKVIRDLKKKTGYTMRVLMSAGIFTIESHIKRGDLGPIQSAMQRELDSEFKKDPQSEASG